MNVGYEDIKTHFEQLRKFILNDLRILVSQENGGNYITACLIACACEVLSWLRYGERNKGETFFANMMLPSQWQPVGQSLYGALRDGIVHGYDTMFIVVGSKRVEIVVSWRLYPHLTFGTGGAYIYLNVQKMAEDLKTALEKYESELKADSKLRGRYFETMKKMKNKWEKRPSHKELQTWNALLSQHQS